MRPNILFIICDQLNARALSCYGGPVPTPNIDRIANEGVRFTEATCCTPFCSPNRASIATGLYPHTHAVIENSDSVAQGLTASERTTESLLSQAGYHTHHYGKWHLFGENPECYPDMYDIINEHPYHKEMEPYYESVRQRDRATWFEFYDQLTLPIQTSAPHQAAVDALGTKWEGRIYGEFIQKMGRLETPLEQYWDVRITDKTVEKLDELAEQDAPFMVTCSFNSPHDPNVVPSPYYEMFDPDEIELPDTVDQIEPRFDNHWGRVVVKDLGEPSLREFLRIYYAMVKVIDDQVGRLLDALERGGLLDNTLVVFTADHGDMMGGHGMVWKSTGAFYDEIARVPLLMRYPTKLTPGVSELAVDGTDFMPTLLGLASKEVPSDVHGQDLMPFLTGEADPSMARSYAFCERISKPERPRTITTNSTGAFMVRGQGYKYVYYPDGDEYLYNLRQDASETRNLADDPKLQSVKEEMRTAISGWLEETAWRGKPAL